MDFLVATSRGADIQKFAKDEHSVILPTYVHSGATVPELTKILEDKVYNFSSPSSSPTKNTHIYILAGSNDITHIDNRHPSRHIKYRECTYTGNVTDTIENIKQNITECSDTIKSLNATPIFCTITPVNIKDYNQHMLRKRWTHTLIHEDKYPVWQSQIEEIIESVNTFIIHLNSSNSLTTPLCHKCIIRHHGKRRRGFKAISWNLLKDGIHGDDKIKKQWTICILNAIAKNRNPSKMQKKSKALFGGTRFL